MQEGASLTCKGEDGLHPAAVHGNRQRPVLDGSLVRAHVTAAEPASLEEIHQLTLLASIKWSQAACRLRIDGASCTPAVHEGYE